MLRGSELLLDRTRPENPCAPNEADVYFRRRLIEPAGTSFLDSMPAYVAAEFCSVLGEFERTVGSVDRLQRIGGVFGSPQLRRAGFAIAKDGREAVNEFLTDYVARMSRHFDLPRMYYAAARRWWNQNLHNPDYHPVMRKIQDHAEENTPLDRGDIFFWPVLRRNIHTLDSAAEE